MHSVDLMTTSSGVTNIKTISSFLPTTGKHFIGNALYSCDDSAAKVIQILYFSWKTVSFTNPRKKSIGVNSGEWGGPGQKMGPSSYPVTKKLPVQKGTNATWEVRCCYNSWLESCSHRDMMHSSVHDLNQKSATCQGVWRWRQQGPLKHWYPTATLHGITAQKTSTCNLLCFNISVDYYIRLVEIIGEDCQFLRLNERLCVPN